MATLFETALFLICSVISAFGMAIILSVTVDLALMNRRKSRTSEGAAQRA